MIKVKERNSVLCVQLKTECNGSSDSMTKADINRDLRWTKISKGAAWPEQYSMSVFEEPRKQFGTVHGNSESGRGGRV